MNIIRAEQLIRTIKKLSREEKGFVRGLLRVETDAEIINKMQKPEKSKKKNGRRHSVYSKEQITQAFMLKKQNISNSQIEKATGVRKGSLANVKWLEQRYLEMRKKKK